MVQVRGGKKRTVNVKRYAASAFPMLLVALGGSAVFMGDKVLLQDIAPSLEDVQKLPAKPKSNKAIVEEYEKRRKRWWKHTKDMPICNHVTAVCSENGLLPRLLASVAAGAKMRSSVMGIGGGPISFIGLVCAAIGIWFADKINKLISKNKEKNVGTTTTTSNIEYQCIKNKASDVEETTSTLYDEESGSSCAQDCLATPTTPSVLKTMYDNAMTYMSGTSFTWANPVATFKIFIALLLFIELNDLMAPEQTIMYTPEIIALQRAKPDPREYVPYMADYLTPSLSYATADLWTRRLKTVRNVLILSWLTYLVLPPKRIGGICYVVGALLYCYLATIGLMYNLGHSMQGGILFILSSIFAVPFLGCPKYGDRSARWLRRFLYIAVLVPIYLFSGVSKFRYKGFWPQVTGSWMLSAFTKKGIRRSVFPGLYTFIRDHDYAMALFSWGNVVVEYLLPLAMLLWIENPLVQALFHVSCILFHISIFTLMGPNFIRYCLMHMLAWNPLGGFGLCPRKAATTQGSTSTTSLSSSNVGPITVLDKIRAGFTLYTMFGWFYVQLISDFEHLIGKVDRLERRNPYFPIPELSMFAKPKVPNFTCSLFLVLISLVCYLVVFFTRWSLDRDSTETDFFYWLPFYNGSTQKQEFKGTVVIPLNEEEISLAKKQGKTFVVFDASEHLSSTLPRRNDSGGDSSVTYVVSNEGE